MCPLSTTNRPTATIAHRGASAYAPENTLTAIRQAVELHSDLVEVDVQRTRDGALVLVHDTELGRTTDAARVLPLRAPWRVSDLTLAEILRLDAGSWFSPAYAGERIPTLEQALDLLALSGTGLQLEVKQPARYPGIATDVAAALRSRPRGPVVVQSFDHRVMSDFARLGTGVPVGLLGHPPVRRLPDLASWASQVNPRHRTASAAYVDAVHAAGMECLVWTADREGDLRRALDLGVDGVITNRPDVLRRVLTDRLVPA
jgi:glycerophosphoryl diester phosphodiesterase